ncbi:hypothetical protein AB9F46_27505 [Rhizobium leguminosarum]
MEVSTFEETPDLGDYKRFQDLHSILLFRACPNASWIHAERLLHKLPATPRQVKHVETLRELVWHFYRALKAYRRRPDHRAARGLQARFDRIFSLRTGYGDLDKTAVSTETPQGRTAAGSGAA